MNREVLLSVVVPVRDEAAVIETFHARLCRTLDGLPERAEILYVNDGSTDDTLGRIQRLRSGDPRVAILDLSRNFGKEIALSAGLDHASGDAVVVIDADLQDPPELIEEFLARWREGYDVVYAKRTARDGESLLKRGTAYLFYRLIRRVSRVGIPEDAGDYRLLSRRAVDAIRRLREHHRFMKGLFAWIGYRQIGVPYRRDPRYAGTSKWSYGRLWDLAIEGLTSFTIVPLKVATYLGLFTAQFAFAYGAFIIVRTLLFGNPVPGYPSLLVVVLFLGGMQLFFIGLIGEYLGRIFNETKGRPLYLVNAFEPAGSPADRRAPP